MRASFATTIFAVTPLLLSQAIAAPTPNFLSNIFSGNNKAAAETQTANIDVPWHFLNIYIFPKRSEDDDVQLRFRFSDDNPGNEISVACSKKASSIEDLHMERYERCGDSDVSFRYQSGKIEVMRNTYVLFFIFYFYFYFYWFTESFTC